MSNTWRVLLFLVSASAVKIYWRLWWAAFQIALLVYVWRLALGS